VGYQKRRCVAHRTDGQPCKRWASVGALVCTSHGAAAPQVKAAAARRNAEAAAAAAARTLGRVGVELTPAEHLLDELYRCAALCDVLAGLVAKLDEREQDIDRADQPVYADGLLAPKPGQRGRTEVTVHPFVELYARERERRARIAKLAIDAGVAEATVRLAERTSGVIVAAYSAALADPALGLDEAQQQTGRSVLARHLRAIDDQD
jgi:hypothetical protein